MSIPAGMQAASPHRKEVLLPGAARMAPPPASLMAMESTPADRPTGDRNPTGTPSLQSAGSPTKNVSEEASEKADTESSVVELMPPPVERRDSISLVILASLAILLALYHTRAIMLPITLSLLMALTFRPVVRRLRRFSLPDPVGAGLLLAAVLGITLLGVANLIGPARDWLESFPQNIARAKEKFHSLSSHFQSFADMSHQVQEFANGDPAEGPVAVQIAQSSLSTNFNVLSNTSDIIASILLVIGLSYFFLAFGDSLLNNTLRVLSSYSNKKKTVELVKDVEKGIALYLFLVTSINLSLGIATAVAMWALGVPNPALWGVMAFAVNYIPVFGSIAGCAMLLLVSVLTFDSLLFAFVPPAVYMGLCAFESNFVTPPLLGRSMSLNPILVFLALIFWGWIWGIGGAFLAVPLLAVMKLTCEKFERTKQIAVLMEA